MAAVAVRAAVAVVSLAWWGLLQRLGARLEQSRSASASASSGVGVAVPGAGRSVTGIAGTLLWVLPGGVPGWSGAPAVRAGIGRRPMWRSLAAALAGPVAGLAAAAACGLAIRGLAAADKWPVPFVVTAAGTDEGGRPWAVLAEPWNHVPGRRLMREGERTLSALRLSAVTGVGSPATSTTAAAGGLGWEADLTSPLDPDTAPEPVPDGIVVTWEEPLSAERVRTVRQDAGGAAAWVVWAWRAAAAGLVLNLVAAGLQLLPLWPLAGSRIVAAFLSRRGAVGWLRRARGRGEGLVVLVAGVLAAAGPLTGGRFDPLGWWVMPALLPMIELLAGPDQMGWVRTVLRQMTGSPL